MYRTCCCTLRPIIKGQSSNVSAKHILPQRCLTGFSYTLNKRSFLAEQFDTKIIWIGLEGSEIWLVEI